MESKVGNIYSNTLFSSLMQSHVNKLDEVNEWLKLFAKAIQNSPVAQRVLSSPIVSSEKKYQILKKVYEQTTKFNNSSMSKVLLRFLSILAKNDRLAVIDSIQAHFEKLTDARNKKLRVHCWVAQTLDQETREKLIQACKKLVHSEVILETSVDASLIGGMVLQVNDFTFDTSIKNKIQRLRQRMII